MAELGLSPDSLIPKPINTYNAHIMSYHIYVMLNKYYEIDSIINFTYMRTKGSGFQVALQQMHIVWTLTTRQALCCVLGIQ